ncbi:hypothetical protein RB653_008069 [Dictyostelium firmibasis]|uniref:Uncharacterized protein n=1 Tax=Dictyostelium firmibasis TaxID=79012 RepID=A0AAN7TS62_9MYCE
MNKILNVFILFLALLIVCDATHFRFGSMSWQPMGTYNTIKFSSNYAFRTTFFDQYKLKGAKVGDKVLVGELDLGQPGKDDIDVYLTVTAVNVGDDWFTGEFTYTHTYPTVTSGKTKTYTAIFTDCCRIKSLLNNAEGRWYISTSVVIDPNQGSDVSKFNRSPVSGMVPIITLNRDKVNNFLIAASDPNNDPLEYSLSKAYTMDQPPGLSINSTTGLVSFKPTQAGFYSTQILIKDNRGAYVVVDFLINSVFEPGVCHPSCSNTGQTCNGNSDCKKCSGSDNLGNTCISAPPAFIYPPTPKNGEILSYELNTQYSFSLQCKTNDSSKTVDIQPANIPSGVTLSSSIQSKQIATLSYMWTPTITNVGTYVISAYCTDSKGLTSTVTSFSISVDKPNCGHGHNTPTGCQCDPGWDPEKNCYECLKDNYGEKCEPIDPCINGAVNNGTQGDGKCICFYGWEGDNCDIKISQVCNANKDNVVTDSSVTQSSYINPNFAQVYLNTDPSKAALTIPSRLSIPFPIKNFDVLVVMDSQPVSKDIWDAFTKSLSSFSEKLNKKYSESISFGLGLFSDAQTNGYSFVLKKSIGNNLEGLTDKDRTIGSSSTYNSLAALSSAAEFPSGWNTGSIRIILLITDNDYSANSQDVSKLTSSLIGQSILPVVVSFGDNTKWSSLFSSQGFGSTKKAYLKSGSDWITMSMSGIEDVLEKAVVKKIDDPNGFLVVPPPTILSIIDSKSTDVSLPIQIKYPQGQSNIPQFPIVSYSVIGFGTTRVVINYNNAPTAKNSSIETKQNVNYNFKLSGEDMDGNTLTVKFKSIPLVSVGEILSNGVTVKQGDSFPIDTTFTFKPTTNYYTKLTNDIFTFVVNDGCLDSGYATVEIKINHVNQAPSCSNVASTVFADKLNSPISFTLTGSDIETDSTLNIVFSDVSVVSSYGVIKSGSNVIATGSTVQLSSGSTSLTFTQTKDITTDKEVTIGFKVNDGSLDSTSCSFKVKFIHFNKAPVAFAVTPITIRQNAQLPITISASDSDSQSVTFTLKSLTLGGGDSFYVCSDSSQFTLPYTTTPITISGGVASFSDICYNSPLLNANNYASLEFYANDGELDSNILKVSININGDRVNNPPVVNQIPDFTMKEDGISNELTIDGIDPDVLDQDQLTSIITTQPKNGVLLVKTGSTTTSTASVSGKAPYKIIYKPNSLFSGTDSFSYTVQDSMGLRDSKPKTTKITVEHVNHPPTLSIDPYSFTSQTPEKTLELTPTDIDVIDTVFKCTIVKLPTNVTIKTSAGVEVKSVPTDLSDNKYIITISNDKTFYSDLSDSFNAKCSDSSKDASNVATGLISFKYINVPPKAISSDERLDQDSSINFSVKATDLEDQPNVKVVIRSLPSKGTLSIKSTGKDAQISSTYPLNDFVYTPIAGYSNWNKPGHVGPADSFNFIAKDSKDEISSNIGTVSFFINPRNPPTYEGVTVLYTKENTDLPFTIKGIVGNGGSNIFLRIQSIVSNGSLHATHCMGSEGCMSEKNPVNISNSFTSEPYTFSFRPVTYENGDNYATIKFVLFDIFDGEEVVSGQYSIIINVIPVNQAPEIILIEHILSTKPNIAIKFDDTKTVTMDINSSVIIKYDGKDIDDGKSNLTSYISNPPLRGTIYVYDENAKDGLGRLVNNNNTMVPMAKDGYWYIVYVPTPGTYGSGYARIPILMEDYLGAISDPTPVVIDVLNKNVAPFITIENRNYTSLSNTSIVVTGVSFDDPDSKRNDVSLVISLVDKDNKVVSNEVSDLSFSTQSKLCVKDAKLSQFTCKANKKVLNTLITAINIIHKKGGSYRLKVFVDDLGYNAPSSVRDENHLTATDYVDLQITEPEVTTKDKDNKTVLTGAIAGAAAGAGLLAAGAWFLLKKSAPPTDAFFGEAAFTEGTVSTNPMYQESGTSAMNPLYEASDI